MRWKSQLCITLPSDAFALSLALDSESLFADDISSSDLTKQEKQSSDPVFETLLSGVNQELATPLREAYTLARQSRIKTFVECVLPIVDKHLAGGRR
jgi:hypothetical protein